MLNNGIFIRQSGLISPESLTMPILIVGAGSIGSWSALALSKLGCSNITVMDGDIVEEHNAGSQIYKASDSGGEKVIALIDKISLLTDLPVFAKNLHWESTNPISLQDLFKYKIVISAVDNMTTRIELFKALQGKDVLYIDSRMAGNALEIYTVRGNVEEDCRAYEKTLFGEEDSLPIPCSERSVVYNVFICAGLIGDLVAKYANKQELPKELIMDLYNLTLFK